MRQHNVHWKGELRPAPQKKTCQEATKRRHWERDEHIKGSWGAAGEGKQRSRKKDPMPHHARRPSRGKKGEDLLAKHIKLKGEKAEICRKRNRTGRLLQTKWQTGEGPVGKKKVWQLDQKTRGGKTVTMKIPLR